MTTPDVEVRDWPPCVQPDPPPAYDFATFARQFAEYCKAVWLADHSDVTAISLPQGVFPDLEEAINPVTRSVVRVERYPLFASRSLSPWATAP